MFHIPSRLLSPATAAALLAVLLAALLWPLALTAQPVVTVDGPTAFETALVEAPEGSTLILAPGDYGALEINGDIGATTIRSADPENPARFSSALVRGIADLSFEGLLFDYTFTEGDRTSERRFIWRNTTGLRLRSNVFDGDGATGQPEGENGYGHSMALSVQSSRDVEIAGNVIYNFYKGVHVHNSENIVVRGNEVYAIRSDGMNFAQVDTILVEGNHLHNFNRALESGDHSDMIQFWTHRTDWSSRNITIRGNILNSGQGYFTQSIFLRNERADRDETGDQSLFYRNVLIEENVIINAHLHGITVGQTDGLIIRNNTVVQNFQSAGEDPTRGLWLPQIRVVEASRDVTVTANIVARINGYSGQASWRVADNLLLEPLGYPTIFGPTPGDGRIRVSDFLYHREGLGGPDGPGATHLRRD